MVDYFETSSLYLSEVYLFRVFFSQSHLCQFQSFFIIWESFIRGQQNLIIYRFPVLFSMNYFVYFSGAICLRSPLGMALFPNTIYFVAGALLPSQRIWNMLRMRISVNNGLGMVNSVWKFWQMNWGHRGPLYLVFELLPSTWRKLFFRLTNSALAAPHIREGLFGNFQLGSIGKDLKAWWRQTQLCLFHWGLQAFSTTLFTRILMNRIVLQWKKIFLFLLGSF